MAVHLYEEAETMISHRILIAVSLFATPMAFAEPYKIELGWGNLPDCTRATCSGKSLFGICPDTIQTGEQRLFAYVFGDAPDAGTLQNQLKHCGNQGLAAATLAAVLASPAAAMPAFSGAFIPCVQQTMNTNLTFNLTTESQCLWR